MRYLWTKEKEREFFLEALSFASPEQLFYLADGRYYAYWPKSYKGKTSTLQSRNALIGKFTEKYSADLLQELASSRGLYAVQEVICKEIGITAQSPADVALCTTRDREQSANNIKAIFEVKMSIVWNWELVRDENGDALVCIGDYTTHTGTPGLLRSDSMLKAIGKGINIRVSGPAASGIPIIVLGNTPITKSYISKVDHLKKSGIVQGFWSLNPSPLDSDMETIEDTPSKGFLKMDSYEELAENLDRILSEKQEFFSAMKSRRELGNIIEKANRENTIEAKAEKFLELLRKSDTDSSEDDRQSET